MYLEIKKRLDAELVRFIKDMVRAHSLNSVSPVLAREIRGFMLRKGKRLRPILFIMSYMGFAGKAAPNLYTSALSLELLHDFLIIHDDIIDKSDARRGKPSLHKRFDSYLARHDKIKFDGQDLAIVAGDIMYAMAVRAFLSIKEQGRRKEEALKKLAEAAILTGTGEFAELLHSARSIRDVDKADIYRIYDLKTAYYSFACPLSAGALLGGARRREADKLSGAGISLGRAFQIKDDILGIFGDEKKTGKSALTDLQEGRNTLLIWRAYNKSGVKDKRFLEKTLSKDNVTRKDLLMARKIVISSGSLDYARSEIRKLMRKTAALLGSSRMKAKYKSMLFSYIEELLRP
jgi:geranylgeranyl diphosphate synthase type I